MMKLLLLFLMLINSSVYAEEGWYPFAIPAKLDPNSPANIGKLVLDPPAGKHGFVKVKDGHFYFEDGTRAKFWGTNLCMDACFPTKKQAEEMSDRLAFFGFNAIRFHVMDNFFEPKGLFKDVCPAYKDPQLKKTTVLSENRLDKLDYLIYQLKCRGVYVYFSLLVTRHFTEADGVKEAAELGFAAKPVSLFDRKLIALQKKYAQDLLTHYNPYTKLRYCDDPAIALIEIANENSFTGKNNNPIPDYYQKMLNANWEKQIREKTIQHKYSKTDFYADLEKEYFDEMIAFLKNELKIKVPITGSQYSTALAQQSCDFIDKHTYWDHPDKFWDKINFKISNKSMLLNKDLGIIGYLINNDPDRSPQISGHKPYTISEWDHCYPNKYAYETPVLIASKALQHDWDGLFQYTYADGWDTVPVFDYIISHFDIIANAQQLLLCSLGSYIYNNVDNLEINSANGYYTINSDKIIGMAGFIKDVTYDCGIISITPKQDGTIFLYSADDKPIRESGRIILISISEIKNGDSGREINKFNWGHPPVMLHNIDFTVGLRLNKYFKVYELTAGGMRGQLLTTLNHESQMPNSIIFSTQNSKCPWFEIVAENISPK